MTWGYGCFRLAEFLQGSGSLGPLVLWALSAVWVSLLAYNLLKTKGMHSGRLSAKSATVSRIMERRLQNSVANSAASLDTVTRMAS